MIKTLSQVTEELAAKRKALAMNKELDALEDERVKLESLEKIKGDNDSVYQKLIKSNEQIYPAKKGDGKVEVKSIGQMFIESKAAEQKLLVHRVDIDTKTLFQASAGWDPEATRIPRVELYPLRELSVVDYIPLGVTSMDTIKYMKESTFTNNAAEAAAGGTYGEAALVYTETSDEVEKIGVWLPVTDEQLEDVAGMTDLLNQRLTYMLKARLDAQVLVGDGTTPNLWGAINLASVQTQAKGADSTPDAIYKAITKVRAVGFANPSLVALHPNDWQAIRLLTTADGIYIFGSPSEAGPDRIWGVPVLQTTAETENTGLVGDWRQYSMLFMKRGIEFQVSNAHSDYFIKGKQAIRCDLRCSMVYFRDTAFCTVTGI
jgi:HK97 family phage major capsid protein